MSKWIRSFFLPLMAMAFILVGSLTLFGHLELPLVSANVSSNFGVNNTIVPGQIAQATGGETSLTNLVRRILNFFLGFLGIISIALVIYGGFQFVTAGVNESGAEQGRNILTYAAIGIIVILLSFVIVNTLLQAAVPGATN